MIVVVAFLKAKKGSEEDLEQALKSMFPKVRHEKGTISYILHRAGNDPGKFLFYEKFIDKEALEYHNSTPYLKELFDRFDFLLNEKPEVDTYEIIEELDLK